MKRNLVLSLLVAVGYLVFTWPAPPAVQAPAPTFFAGAQGTGPTEADRKAAEYWRKHPRPKTRSAKMAIAVASLSEANNSGLGTSLSVTVPAGGVSVGSRVVAVFSMVHTLGTVSCADDRSNTYAADADVSNDFAQRLVILSAPITTALQENDSITITSPSGGNRCLSVAVITGLADGGELDQFSTATGESGTPDSGSITTTSADEALIGAAARRDEPFLNTFAVGANWTALTPSPNNSGVLVQPGYRVVNATGTYTADFTLDPAMSWAAAVVSYQAAGSAPQTLTPDAVSYSYVVPSPTVAHVVTVRPEPAVMTWGFFTPLFRATDGIGRALKRWRSG